MHAVVTCHIMIWNVADPHNMKFSLLIEDFHCSTCNDVPFHITPGDILAAFDWKFRSLRDRVWIDLKEEFRCSTCDVVFFLKLTFKMSLHTVQCTWPWNIPPKSLPGLAKSVLVPTNAWTGRTLKLTIYSLDLQQLSQTFLPIFPVSFLHWYSWEKVAVVLLVSWIMLCGWLGWD